MIIFTQKHLRLKHVCLLLFVPLITLSSKAQQVTEIITDFGGFWRTNSTTNNTTKPNDSHNLLAFTVGGTLYSTGANNAVLTSNGVSFTNGNFKCLPITSVTGMVTSIPSAIGLAVNYDGVPNGSSNPLPTVKMKDVFTDGINGLNIGTGVIDVPVSARLTFPVQSIDVNSITDAKPDILFTQIADISPGYTDTMYFVNSTGVVVGNKIVVSWISVPVLGNYLVDFYDLQTNVPCDQAVITGVIALNNTRPLRLTAFKLSDFGITSSNKSQVASLILHPSGKSDVGFVAYNSDAFVIAPPAITAQPQTQVVCTGASSSATFSVTATGSGDTYQWRKDGVDIAGANGSSYTISPVTASSAAAYDVVVTNGGGSVTSNKAYLNVEIIKQPASQTIVTGNIVTLSITATNTTSFQWKKNGVNIPGATDSIYTISPLNSTDGGSYTVSAINNASAGCATVLSNPAVITPAIVVYSKSSPDINIPSTWGANTDGSGSTPVDFTRSEHTFVLSNRPSGNTLTNLTIAGTLDVSNSIAIIADNTTLDVGWCIRSGVGSLSGSNSSSFTTHGNSNLYFTPGKQILKNFTVAGGTVNMLSDLTISGGTLPGKLNLTGGTLAVGSNKITISSTSTTNTSMVTALGSGASITYGTGGAFIVERFIPAKRSFRLISPAVTTTTSIKNNWMEGVVNPDRWTNYDPLPGYGTHITGPRTPADSLDVTQTYNPSLFTFDNLTQTWVTIGNSSSTLTAGSPYRLMVRGSRAVDLNNNDATPSNTILRATGVLTTGNYSIGSNRLSTRIGGYNFIGNPYACPINWLTLSKSGIGSSYYIWDETIGRRGAYVVYNGAAQTSGNPSSAMNENIQSGQAFFAQSTSTTPSITFSESNKSYTNTAVFRTAATQTKLSAQLLLNTNGGTETVTDGFTAVYDDAFSKSIGDEDSYKFTNLDENMSINRDGIRLSVEGRPLIKGQDTLPIKILQYRQKEYWLKIDAANFDPYIHATFKDAYLKKDTIVDLSSSTVIPFTVNTDSASFAPDRFSIVFDYIVPPPPPPVFFTNVVAYQKDKGIQVNWNTGAEINLERYEVEKSVNNKQFNTVFAARAKSDKETEHYYSWFDDKASSSNNNYYRIKIFEKNGNYTYSAVARVTLPDRNRTITIEDNVKGTAVSLQFTNIAPGKYDVNIYNTAGQKVYTGTWNSGNSTLQSFELNQRLAGGSYILQLTDGKTTIAKTIIVK